MSEPTKVVLSWSGGKDSALALHALQQNETCEVVSLLTTVSREYGRISHHGVREELLDQQAEAIGIPLHKLELPSNHGGPCTNEQYEGVMRDAMLHYRSRGVTTVAFGDIYLEDLRRYREEKLAGVGMSAVFPIWGGDPAELVGRFIREGFRSRLCCVDKAKLGEAFAGRLIDHDLLRDLPDDIDPCGERGEYHSFTYAGPIFRRPLELTIGRTVLRDVRYFTDLLPAPQTQETAHARA